MVNSWEMESDAQPRELRVNQLCRNVPRNYAHPSFVDQLFCQCYRCKPVNISLTSGHCCDEKQSYDSEHSSLVLKARREALELRSISSQYCSGEI